MVWVDGLATTSPLVTKALLRFLTEAYLHAKYPALYPKAPPIGKGIGLAVGLFAMQGEAYIPNTDYCLYG
jgi:ATP-binding cassette subfamily C (CFTR/MRP) protein 1